MVANPADRVALTRDVDDPRLGREQLVHDEVREEEETEVVELQLGLEPVLGLVVRRRHRPDVVDKHIDLLVHRQDVLCGGTDIGERRKINGESASGDGAQSRSDFLRLGFVTETEDDQAWLGGLDRLEEAGAERVGRRTEDEDRLAFDVLGEDGYEGGSGLSGHGGGTWDVGGET